MRALLFLVPTLTAAIAYAEPSDAREKCTDELDARGIAWKRTSRPGIKDAVEITGPLGGVPLTSERPLIVDCSLAVSLDEAGKYMHELGIEKAYFSSAYSRRNGRFTNHPSKHSFGLAIDIHTFTLPDLGTLRVDRDYEQGLGDDYDCVGSPLTRGGAVLKVLQCQLVRSGLFRLVLSPDYDDAHHDHFHLEALPWSGRSQLRASTQAIH
jgi:hypothetical protein